MLFFFLTRQRGKPKPKGQGQAEDLVRLSPARVDPCSRIADLWCGAQPTVDLVQSLQLCFVRKRTEKVNGLEGRNCVTVPLVALGTSSKLTLQLGAGWATN